MVIFLVALATFQVPHRNMCIITWGRTDIKLCLVLASSFRSVIFQQWILAQSIYFKSKTHQLDTLLSFVTLSPAGQSLLHISYLVVGSYL